MTSYGEIKYRVVVCILLLTLSRLAIAQPQPFRPAYQFAKGESAGGFFGQQIAVVGNAVAVSARDDDRFAPNGGAVYIYDSEGEFLMVIGSPNAQNGGRFGSYMTQVGNDRILVGANFEDDAQGNAYLFDLKGNLLKEFSSPNPSSNSQFGGRFLLANEESIFIPAWFDSQLIGDEQIRSGAIYKYNHEGDLVDTFVNPLQDSDGSNCLGRSAAFVGSNSIVVGDACHSEFSDVDDPGGAVIFDLSGNVLHEFEDPMPSGLNAFGSSTAAAGGRLLIGGVQIDDLDTGASSGAAYIYETDGTLVTRVSDPEPMAGNWFGWNAGGILRDSGDEQFLVGSIFNSGAGKVFIVSSNGGDSAIAGKPNAGSWRAIWGKLRADGRQATDWRDERRRGIS